MNKLLASLVCFLCFSSAVFAEGVWVSGNIKADLKFEEVSSYSQIDGSSNNVNQEVSTSFVELFPEFQLNFSENFSLKNSWQFLVLKEDQGGDRFFEDQGLVLDELYFNFDNEKSSFFLGKYNPKFGYAWNESIESGMWGNDLAEQYRITGKVGLGFAAKFDLVDYGKHRIDVATFYDDTTMMNDALLTRRDRSRTGVGDMSDTDSLSSYTINISGSDMWGYPGLFYNLSYRNLEGVSQSLVSKEEGFAYGIGADLEILPELKFEPYFEYVRINGFNSFNNRFNIEFSSDDFIPADAEYVTLILSISYGVWHLNYLYSQRDTDSNISANDIGSFSTEEVNLAYDLNDFLRLTLARKEDVLSGSYKSQSVGMMLEYDISF